MEQDERGFVSKTIDEFRCMGPVWDETGAMTMKLSTDKVIRAVAMVCAGGYLGRYTDLAAEVIAHA